MKNTIADNSLATHTSRNLRYSTAAAVDHAEMHPALISIELRWSGTIGERTWTIRLSAGEDQVWQSLKLSSAGESQAKMVASHFKTALARAISRNFPRLWLERELRFRPNHFERELWLIPMLCNHKKIAIDVGANMGAYSYYMAKHSKRVVLFEPNLDLWPHLRRILGPGCELVGVALSARSSTSLLRLDRQNTGVATIEQSNDLSCVTDLSAVISRTVETRTLDSYELTEVSLIKIDVEGHEEAVIEGSLDTITRSRPAFIIESEDRHNPGAPRRLASRMSEMGYRGFYLGESGLSDVAQLSDANLDPSNLISGEHAYVNNFIFIPKEEEAKLERLRASSAKS